jgi:hypothetical protein
VPYTGNLKATAAANAQGFYYRQPALHTADEAHDYPGQQDGPVERARYSGGPAAPIQDEDGAYVTTTDGIVLDQTPWSTDFVPSGAPETYDAHDDLDPQMIRATRFELDDPGANDAQVMADTDVIHGRDIGGPIMQYYPREQALQFSNERYLKVESAPFGATVGDTLPALAGGGRRGLNSYSVNNPPDGGYLGMGFWPGHMDKFLNDRKFAARLVQRHDHGPLFPNVAAYEVNSPPLKGATPYNSPFDSLARVLVRSSQRAQVRRNPPSLTEGVEVDGTEDQTPALADDAEWMAG